MPVMTEALAMYEGRVSSAPSVSADLTPGAIYLRLRLS